MVTLLLALACADPRSDDAGGRDTSEDTGASDDTASDDTAADDTALDDTAIEPTDADGDGYPVDEDCDDQDATIHPDALDACDGVDRNCDGAVVDEGGCGGVTDILETNATPWYRDYLYASAGCVTDRDCVWTPSGGDVLLDKTALEDVRWGGYAIYRWSGDGFDYALQLALKGGEVYTHASVIGDFDGDGTDDLAIHGGSVSDYIAELALISGDESRWPTGLAYVDDAAFAVWEGLNGGDQFSEELDVGDVDGDGLVDIVTHAPANVGADNGGKSGWLFVLPGRTSGFPTPGDARALTEEWYYPHSRDVVDNTGLDEAFALEAVHPDLDGDGLADLVAHGYHGWYAVVPGANLVSMRGSYIEHIVGPEEIAPCWRHDDDISRIVDIAVGDFDGSGIPDVVLSQRPYPYQDSSIPMYVLFDLALPWDDPTRW